MRKFAALYGVLQVRADRRKKPMRRRFECAGTEHEHESPAAAFSPFDTTDAADPRVNRPAEHVETHDVPHVDPETLDDTFFDRHLWQILGSAPRTSTGVRLHCRFWKRAFEQRFVRLE